MFDRQRCPYTEARSHNLAHGPVKSFHEFSEFISRMNIKGIVNNLIPIDFFKTDLRKTRNTADRDPQQGGDGGGETPQRHQFTDQELDEVLKHLRELPGVKVNNLQIRVEKTENRVVVFVEDVTGKVVRRIPDTELWFLMKSRSTTVGDRGNLLNKAL
jgi:uncharacterized FlaG/YvyC family protein